MVRRLLAAALLCFASVAPAAPAERDRNIVAAVRTSQDDVNAGRIPLTELFYRGAHLFTNRFTTLDALGEAPDGPRRGRLGIGGNAATPFLRFNGLDAQSCLECHAAGGFRQYGGLSMPRDRGVTGAGAGFSANVFIFEQPGNMRDGIVRNPPHVFGAGYTQRLADEMTDDILTLRDAATTEALTLGKPVRVRLESKGVQFGYLTVLPTGGMDRSELDGISIDMVVRPFQFKGVASTIRNFVAGAMNFHFSVQPRELMRRHFIADDNPTGMVAGDQEEEIGEGEISAVAIFIAALRPPVQDLAGLDPASVARGRALMDSAGCTDCHRATLRLRDPRVTIMDPRPLYIREAARSAQPEYVSIRERLAAHPAAVPMVAAEAESDHLAPVLSHRLRPGDRPIGYTVDLQDPALPDEAHPRLPQNADGTVDVPLFSDLRRHRMGSQLADTVDQRTEMNSILVPREEFVTRALWGVADTGPWLHDGRATTLAEAILMHEGPGSEANDSIARFRALPAADQASLVDFLRGLRIAPMGHEMEPGVSHRAGFAVH